MTKATSKGERTGNLPTNTDALVHKAEAKCKTLTLVKEKFPTLRNEHFAALERGIDAAG